MKFEWDPDKNELNKAKHSIAIGAQMKMSYGLFLQERQPEKKL